MLYLGEALPDIIIIDTLNNMKSYTIMPLLGLFTLLAACNAPANPKKIAPAERKNHKIVKHYTCTMHPAVITDKPGLCPKCGMDLVEKNN